MDLTINRTQQTMGSVSHGQPHTSSIFNATDTSSQSFSFSGFSPEDFSYVPSHIWEVSPKKDSITIDVHNEAAFRLLENQVLHEYGEPTNMVHNGNIYRGCDPCGAAIVVTFYQSTFNVRVQGAGYAYWANKVLPKFAKVVMDQLQTPDDDSIDNADVTVRSTSHHTTIVGSQSGSPSTSLPSASVPNFSMYGESLLTSTPAANKSSTAKLNRPNTCPDPLNGPHAQCNVQNELIVQLLNTAKLNGKYEAENATLQAKIVELENRNRTMQIQFSKERDELLKQIQDLSSKATQRRETPAKTTSYRDSLLNNQDWPPLTPIPPQQQQHQPRAVPQPRTATSPPRPQPKAQGPAQIPVSNRFSVLSDHHDNDTDSLHSDATEQSSPPSPLNAKTPSFISSRRKRKPASPQSSQPEISSEPNVVILGDSISRRIDSKRLLKKGNVTNLSKGGRRIDQVCDDINSHQATISTASSLIVHVGTNNLKHDSVDDIKLKLHKLKDAIKARAAQKCEIAFSSVIRRRDIRDSKVDAVNHILSDICDNNRWTYIDNSAIRKDILTDDVHPNPKGMSYLARNLQDFLRCVYPHLFPRTIYPKWVTYLMS